jgi:hypothetical protein
VGDGQGNHADYQTGPRHRKIREFLRPLHRNILGSQ